MQNPRMRQSVDSSSTIPTCPVCSGPLRRSHVHDGFRYTNSAGSVLTTRAATAQDRLEGK